MSGEGSQGFFDKVFKTVLGPKPKEITLGEMSSQFEVKRGESWIFGSNPRGGVDPWGDNPINLNLYTHVARVEGLELPAAALSIRLNENGNPVIRSCARARWNYGSPYRHYEVAIWHKLPRTKERYWDEWARKPITFTNGLTEEEIASAGVNQIVEIRTTTAGGMEPIRLRANDPIIHTLVLKSLGSTKSASQDGIRWRVEIDPKEVNPNKSTSGLGQAY